MPSVASTRREAVEPVTATLRPVTEATCFSTLVGSGRHSAFQSPFWLSSWFTTMRCESIIARYWLDLRDAAGETVLGMPLVMRREAGLLVLEGADLCVSDYTAPVIHPRASARGAITPAACWAALRAAMPQADILRMARMPADIDGLHNPFVAHRMAGPSRQSGWLVELPANWECYFASLSPRMREKLGKARRRFLRQPNTRFAIAETSAEALHWLTELEAMQSQRIAEKGLSYALDRHDVSAFYRDLIVNGLESGSVAMAAMLSGDEIVAVNFAVVSGDRATYLRVANQFGPWHPMTPGQLVTKHLMRSLHARGVRKFDFALGDYDYKKRFGAQPVPLVDVEIATSLRGLPRVISNTLRSRMRRNALLRRMLGRKPLETVNEIRDEESQKAG